MYLVPFFQVEPELAAQETRTVTLFEPRDGIPAGSYGLIESYCPDPGCNCRRVMINVVEQKRPGRFLASIGYGFDRTGEYAGPFLDPLNDQCPYAGALMRLVTDIALSRPDYVSRLKRHYAMVKRAAADPAHPAYETLREAAGEDEESLASALRGLAPGTERVAGPDPRVVGRNELCPCGSGKKFKQCCGRRARSRRG